MSSLKLRGVWCYPGDLGSSADSVAKFLDKAHRNGFNALFLHLKGGDGRAQWPSTRHPDQISRGFENFDLPAILVEQAKPLGFELHAWFIDFFGGGPAFENHPDWAMTDALGRRTSEETLRGAKYGAVWMCPARRPGVTDQYLIPLYADFAERYAFHSVHHDYVRYPGDLAPDQYCFCDYCLEAIPKYAGLIPLAHPERPYYHDLYDRPYIESHWEQTPRALPANWDALPRQMKARFLLEGSTFQGGRADLDYFFYEYRRHWINEFCRECATAVRAARPEMEISAAVFKNPVQSGRFIGQDWRDFAPWVETVAPMDYRDHFPGDFQTYLDLLAPTIEDQKLWAKNHKRLVIGAAVNFLFWDEERPLGWLIQALKKGDQEAAERHAYPVRERLYAIDPSLEAELTRFLREPVEDLRASLVSKLEATARAPRAGHLEPEKLLRTIRTIRNAGAEGVVLFCANQLDHYGLWEEAARGFAE